MQPVLAQDAHAGLVNIDHYGKFRSAGTAPVREGTGAIDAGCLEREGDPCSVKAPGQHLFRANHIVRQIPCLRVRCPLRSHDGRARILSRAQAIAIAAHCRLTNTAFKTAHLAILSLLIRRVATRPSADQSKAIVPPSCAATLRCINLLPKPSGAAGAEMGGPPRSVHTITTSLS